MSHLQDAFNNRIAAANVTCTLNYFGETGEQLPRFSDACKPADGDDSALLAAIYAVKAGVYSIMLVLQQDDLPEVSVAGEISSLRSLEDGLQAQESL